MNDLKKRKPPNSRYSESSTQGGGCDFPVCSWRRPHPTSNSVLQHLPGKTVPVQVLTYVVTCWEYTGRNSVAVLENTTLPCGREGGREGNSKNMTVTLLELQALEGH